MQDRKFNQTQSKYHACDGIKKYSQNITMKLWQPTQTQIDQALITEFAKQQGIEDNNYQALHDWSIRHSAEFWNALWGFCGVIGDKGEATLEQGEHMLGAKWFPDAQLNYAENLLNGNGVEPNISFYGEDQVKRSWSFTELKAAVSQCQQALLKLGLTKGDRVAAMLPNSLEAIAAMLATTSLGAVWSSASPDFGADGVLDRFGMVNGLIAKTRTKSSVTN